MLLADNAYGSAPRIRLLLLAGNLAAKSRAAVRRFVAACHGISSARAVASAWQLNMFRSTNERGEPLNHRSSEASQLVRLMRTCPALAKCKVIGSRSL